MRIADRDQVDVAIADEARVLIRVLIDADRKDGEIGIVVMQLKQGRKLLDTGSALTPPEIQQDHLAAVVGQMNGSKPVGDIEVGGLLACLRGMGSAVAAGNNGQNNQQRCQD